MSFPSGIQPQKVVSEEYSIIFKSHPFWATNSFQKAKKGLTCTFIRSVCGICLDSHLNTNWHPPNIRWLFWKKILISPRIEKVACTFFHKSKFFSTHLEIRKEYVGYKRKALHWRRHVIKTRKINWIRIQSLELRCGENVNILLKAKHLD